MNNILNWSALFLGVIIACFSQIILKKSTQKKYKNILMEYLNPHVIIGYGMLFGSTILGIFAYKKLEYKNGPVIESLGFLLIMILSKVFFNEPITKKKIIGNLLILFGIFIFYI